MSIQKRGNVWRARYRGPDYRERNKTFDRKIDAQRWLSEQKARMNRGDWIDPAASRVAFGKVMAEWSASMQHLKPKTRASYESLLRTRVLPTWERVPLARMTHDALVEWVADMAREGLSASRIRQAVYVVSLVCNYAIRTGRLARNPTAAIRLPRVTVRKERVFLTHAQVAALAEAAGPYATFIRTLAYTGLRWGEATAIRVRDVDLRRRASTSVVPSPTSAGDRGRHAKEPPGAHRATHPLAV